MDEQRGVYSRRSRAAPAPLLLPSQPGGTAGSAPLFDFRALLRLLQRRTALILLVTAICVAVTAFLHSLAPQFYSAHTRILLDEQNVNPFGNQEIFSDLRLSNPAVESQMQLMRSPYLLSQVVGLLDLGENETFMAPATTPMRERLSELRASLLPNSEPEPEVTTEAERFQAAVERLQENLRVSRNAQTLVIRLEFSSTSPELAAEVVNAVAETYIQSRLNVRQETAEQATLWFDERMAELNVRAVEVEQRMERLSGGGAAAMDASQTAEALQMARVALQESMASSAQANTEMLRLRTIVESGRGLRGIPPSVAPPSILPMIEEAAEARAALAAALTEDADETVEIDRLTARIAELEANAEEVLASLLLDAETRAEEAAAAEAEAEAAFEAARAAGGGSVTNAIEVELRSLEGEARIYRELNDSYLESYLRTVQQQSFPSTEATIIETAVTPQYPDGAGLSRLVVLAVLIGLSMGAGSAFVLEASDGRIRTSGQLQKASRAPFLGALPSADADTTGAQNGSENLRLPSIRVPRRSRNMEQDLIALPENRVSLMIEAPQMYAAITNPLSQFSETIRRVNVEADNLQNLLPNSEQTDKKIIGFISDQPSHGRSIAAINYAEMLAVGGSLTVLIDLDWTGLFLTDKIAPAARSGLAELVASDGLSRNEQAFWYDERTSLYFLPNRSMAEDATLDPGSFDQTRLKLLISALLMKFDNVVLDLSPMATSSDPAAMTDLVSGFVAVADWGKTRTASLSSELRRAGIHPPQLLGTVLNGVSMKELEKYESAA